MNTIALQVASPFALATCLPAAGLAQTPQYRYAEIVTKSFIKLPFDTSAAVDSGQVEIIVTRSGRQREVRNLDYDYASVSAAMNALAPLGWEYVEAVSLASDDAHQLRWVVRRAVTDAERTAVATPTYPSTRD